jgi:hypothetical protein
VHQYIHWETLCSVEVAANGKLFKTNATSRGKNVLVTKFSERTKGAAGISEIERLPAEGGRPPLSTDETRSKDPLLTHQQLL